VPAPVALFRCDASPELGGGHLVRCLALAEGLREAGWICHFAVNRQAPHIVPQVMSEPGATRLLEEAEIRDASAIKKWLPGGVDCAVVDHYDLGEGYESSLRGWARAVLSIDDLADRAHECDFLVDATLGRSPEEYADRVPRRTRLFLGPRYALLRPQFPLARVNRKNRVEGDHGLHRLLVSLGRSDPDNLTGRVLSAIALADVACRIDVAIGTGERLGELEALADKLRLSAQFYENVEDMAELMCRADLSIGGGGSTAWERCCLGLPSLIIVLADNQRRIAMELTRIGASRAIESTDHTLENRVGEQLSALASHPGKLKKMGETAFSVCDGLGVSRVVDVLRQECN